MKIHRPPFSRDAQRSAGAALRWRVAAKRFLCLLAMLAGMLAPAHAHDFPPRPVRFMLMGPYNEIPSEDFLKFVEEIRPDIVIMGYFDAGLYAQAAPLAKKPPVDVADQLARWKKVADRLHRNNIRLIGLMHANVVSDRPLDEKESTGFVGFFDRLWDEKLLGKKPARKTLDLLEAPDLHGPSDIKVPEGDAVAECGCRVNTKALRGCINKESWRETTKRMVKAAVDHGVDGFLTNRNYFGHYACDDCRTKFRRWLGERYSAAELKSRFGIADLAAHKLTCVVGAHREIETVPSELVLEKQRFAKHMMNDFMNEVFLHYGRSLKKDLFVGQWNHAAFFDELHLDKGHLPPATRTTFAHVAADERWSLPADLWGRGEDLLWYCNWGTTQNTILAKEYAGDTTLYGLWLRAMARGKPYVINKYDFYRPRVMMAEAAALGYATNAIATPWQHADDRAVMTRYFSFLRQHGDLYQNAEPLAEIGLVFPRRALHAGDAAPIEYVEAAGRTMIREHLLFDMLPDDLLPKLPLDRFKAIVIAGTNFLEKKEREALARYVKQGGQLVELAIAKEDRDRPAAMSTWAGRQLSFAKPLESSSVKVASARTDRAALLTALHRVVGKEKLSRFEAPWTVEVQAYQQSAQKRIMLHLVNYNHQENTKGASVSEREAPIAAQPVPVRLQMPPGMQVKSVRFLSPDGPAEQKVAFQQNGMILECRSPGFLVYGLLAIE